jgi:transposase-like protein
MRMAAISEDPARAAGVVEADGSHVGPHRIRGRRGCGAGRKTIVFGLLKRGGRVFTQIVPDGSRPALQAVIRGRVPPEAVIHTDGWPGCDGLVDPVFEKHLRVRHSANEFALSATSTASRASGRTRSIDFATVRGFEREPSACI